MQCHHTQAWRSTGAEPDASESGGNAAADTAPGALQRRQAGQQAGA